MGWESKTPGVKVLETSMKTRVKILEAREFVIPGLGRSWDGDIVKGSMDLGTGLESGWLEILAHFGLHHPVCNSTRMLRRYVIL